jgi:hypothetical protein
MAISAKERLRIGEPKFPHEGEVRAIAFTLDGKRFAACDLRWTTVWSVDGERIWTAAPGGRPFFLEWPNDKNDDDSPPQLVIS